MFREETKSPSLLRDCLFKKVIPVKNDLQIDLNRFGVRARRLSAYKKSIQNAIFLLFCGRKIT